MTHSWARYKVGIGYTIWDNDCGLLPNLDETPAWAWAQVNARTAERMIEMTDRHAYHGTIVAWCGWDHPVLLRPVNMEHR